jgi:hypothetical protein
MVIPDGDQILSHRCGSRRAEPAEREEEKTGLMSSSKVIPDEAQDHFWSVVRNCVREFHADRASSVLSKVTRLRQKVERLPTEETELFYHAEPFDVACRLADHPLKVEDYLERYLQIRDKDNQDRQAPWAG